MLALITNSFLTDTREQRRVPVSRSRVSLRDFQLIARELLHRARSRRRVNTSRVTPHSPLLPTRRYDLRDVSQLIDKPVTRRVLLVHKVRYKFYTTARRRISRTYSKFRRRVPLFR